MLPATSPDATVDLYREQRAPIVNTRAPDPALEQHCRYPLPGCSRRAATWTKRWGRGVSLVLNAAGPGGNLVEVKFGDLRPGDEITIRTYGQLSCLAKVAAR